MDSLKKRDMKGKSLPLILSFEFEKSDFDVSFSFFNVFFFSFFLATKHLCFMMVVHSLFDNLFGLPFKAPYQDNREAAGPCCKLTRS